MINDIEAMWSERKKAFTKEIFPYFRYVGQSGFLVFLSMIGIISTIQYIQLLQNIPDQFPIGWIGVFIITPFLCYSPLRTWLKEADLVYTMPMEQQMTAYLQQSMKRSFRISFFILALVVLIYWPLYRHADVYYGAVFIIVIVALKIINYRLSWKERQCAWSHHRLILRLFRYTMMFILLMGWLHFDSKGIFMYSVLLLATLFLVYRLPTKQPFPWLTLLDEEKRTVRRVYSFLSWFVDVPSQGTIVKVRPYLSWLPRLISHQHRNTFTYLQMITFVRSEISAISIRLILLGGLITYICADEMVFAGWGATISYFIFAVILTVQISSLRQVHRHALWQHIFPLQIEKQHAQLIQIERWLSYLTLVPLFILGSIPLWKASLWSEPLITMVAILLIMPIVRAMLSKRKFKKEQDDFE